MSLAARLGLPEAFQTTLLLIAIVLTLVPYFAGATIGSLQIPKLDPHRRRRLRVGGPLGLLASIALLLPLPVLRPPDTDLHLLAVDVAESGDIDLVMANSGTSAALLTAIELEVIGDRGIAARPVLPPSATYRVAIDDVAVGGRKKVPIRHLVPAGAIERIIINPATARALVVTVRVYAANGAELSATVALPPALHSR